MRQRDRDTEGQTETQTDTERDRERTQRETETERQRGNNKINAHKYTKDSVSVFSCYITFYSDMHTLSPM